MSVTTDAMLAVGKQQTLDQVRLTFAATKKNFLDTFSDFILAEDLVDLDELFQSAFAAKVLQFTAQTNEQAEEAADIYEADLNSIESIGRRYEIVGKAKLGKVVRSFAHQAISGIFAVAGAVLQVALNMALPGVGGLIGAGINAGIQHVVAYFNTPTEN